MTFKQSPAGFRNVQGPLIEAVQAKLNAGGFNAGTEDGVWGSNTLNALRAWQTAAGLPATGIIDDQTWAALFATPAPALSERALQLTGAWEGTGYGGTNGNGDGQGITWGVVGFTWANGELQGILGEIQNQYPEVFAAAFGPLAGQMTQILGQSRPEQMTFARSISANNGDSIQAPWAAAFKALGDDPNVQAIENQHAQHYWNAGMVFANDFGLLSEDGLALCFDIAVQNTVTDAMIVDIQQQITGMGEVDKMRIIAQAVADHANPVYYQDVLDRKLTFVTGQGTVHGDSYDISCWGLG